MRGVNAAPAMTFAMRGGLLSPKNGRPRIGELSVTAARASHLAPDTVTFAPSGYEAASRKVVGVPVS